MSALDGLAYPAARIVAGKVHAHFERHRRAAADDAIVAPLPAISDIEVIVETAFWASLRREEGYVPRVSLAFLPPGAAEHALVFERPLPLAPAALTRVAPAVDRAGIHLGVWHGADGLELWGTTRAIPMWCFVLEVAAPGLLVVKHHRGTREAKFVNVAVLEGDQVKIIDEYASALPDCPSVLSALIGFDGRPSGDVNVLVELAVSMRAHGRGGTLLVVPSDSDDWRESIVRPIAYGLAPAFVGLAQLAREVPRGARPAGWRSELSRAVEAIAGLTAVDGAALITNEYQVLAFGAKITRRKGAPLVEQLTLTEPVEGSVTRVVEPSQLGGTRHYSAAQFVHDQRGAVALVASQDGHFTIFAWSPCEAMVHAHRVDTLLL